MSILGLKLNHLLRFNLELSPSINSMGKAFDAKNQDIPTHIEIFLVCKALGKKERRSHFKKFFAKNLQNVQSFIITKPIFFDEEQAIDYAKFISDDQTIIKAYVPEAAIIGHYGALAINPKLLQPKYVHSCYNLQEKNSYFSNPYFDNSLPVRVARLEE